MANTAQNGKGSKRRKTADDTSFNDNFDNIDWSKGKQEEEPEQDESNNDIANNCSEDSIEIKTIPLGTGVLR